MKQTSSQIPQMEVGYRLVFHTSNHQIYSYTLNISYLFLVILIVLSTSGFHLYFPGLSALQVFYMLFENIPLYPYFRPADGQFHFVPLLLYTMKQSFLTYFLHIVMTYILWIHIFLVWRILIWIEFLGEEHSKVKLLIQFPDV